MAAATSSGALPSISAISLTVFLLSSFFAAVHYTVLLAAKRVKMTDALPFVPYVAAACAVYWVFLWDKMGILLTDLGFTF